MTTETQKTDAYRQGMMHMAHLLSEQLCAEHRMLWSSMSSAITRGDSRLSDHCNSELMELDRVLQILNDQTRKILEEDTQSSALLPPSSRAVREESE